MIRSSRAYLIYGCIVDEFIPSDEFKTEYDKCVENDDIYYLHGYTDYGFDIPILWDGISDDERVIGVRLYKTEWSPLELKDPFTALRKAAKLWKKYSNTPGKIYLVSSYY